MSEEAVQQELDITKDALEWYQNILKEALNEYAIKNDLSEAPEKHWSRKILDEISSER